MVDTGINPTSDVITKFNAVKTEHSLGWIVLEFGYSNPQKKSPDLIQVAQEGAKGSTFEQLKEHLPKASVRFFVYDCKYQVPGTTKEKVALVNWSDDDASSKLKMLSASGFENLKKKFQGIGCSFEIHDYDDLNTEYVHSRIAELCN